MLKERLNTRKMKRAWVCFFKKKLQLTGETKPLNHLRDLIYHSKRGWDAAESHKNIVPASVLLCVPLCHVFQLHEWVTAFWSKAEVLSSEGNAYSGGVPSVADQSTKIQVYPLQRCNQGFLAAKHVELTQAVELKI